MLFSGALKIEVSTIKKQFNPGGYQMIRRNMTKLSVSVAILMAAGTAQAATWQAGEWELGLGGNVNAFLMHTSCSAGDLKSGGATMAGLACAGSVDEKGNPTDSQSVQNGLLPASLNFSAKTKQEGWDIGANVNVYYGINSNDGSGPDALKFSSVDARQVFLTAGKSGIGEFKLGRDFGLFGFDAIIGDMSLIGGGANFLASDPGHTTLGGLGYGYVYVDRLAQMNYTTPSLGGFKGTLGIFQPLDGNGATSAGELGFHGKASYTKGPATVSATFLTQAVNTTAGTSEDITGVDVFAKVDIGKIGLAGYAYEAEGMTSLAIGGLVLPGFSATGTPEETSGQMLQATYKATPKLKVGVNYGHSEQDVVTKVENDKITLGAYYNLTKSMTLMAEYSQNESDLKGAGTDESSNINIGAFVGF